MKKIIIAIFIALVFQTQSLNTYASFGVKTVLLKKILTDWCLTESTFIKSTDGRIIGETRKYKECGSVGNGLRKGETEYFFEE